MSRTLASTAGLSTLTSALRRVAGLFLLGALASATTAVAAPTAADLNTLKGNVATCTDGLTLLTSNAYAYPAKVTDAPSGKRAWSDAYDTFKKSGLPACDAVGTFLSANKGYAPLAAYEAQLGTDGRSGWADYFTGRDGVTAQGDRIGQYCPALHKSQFDCVSAPQRIGARITELGSQMKRITAVYSPPQSDLTQLKADVTTCRAGMTLLSANMYAYPAKVNEAANGKRAWTDAYGEFKKTDLPGCDAIGRFLTTFKGYPGLSGVEAAIAADGGGWADYYTGRAGLISIGDRIGSYCPNLHKSQYDCVRASTDSNTDITRVNKVLDLLGAL